MILDCNYRYDAENPDTFTIKYNTLIYLLQSKCGFKIRSFITTK
jgi:hypothetical protein